MPQHILRSITASGVNNFFNRSICFSVINSKRSALLPNSNSPKVLNGPDGLHGQLYAFESIRSIWSTWSIKCRFVPETRKNASGLLTPAYGFRDREYNKIENLSTTGNFKREINMSFCYKQTMRLFYPLFSTFEYTIFSIRFVKDACT